MYLYFILPVVSRLKLKQTTCCAYWSAARRVLISSFSLLFSFFMLFISPAAKTTSHKTFELDLTFTSVQQMLQRAAECLQMYRNDRFRNVWWLEHGFQWRLGIPRREMCWKLCIWEASNSCCFLLATSWVTVHLSHSPALSLQAGQTHTVSEAAPAETPSNDIHCSDPPRVIFLKAVTYLQCMLWAALSHRGLDIFLYIICP